MADSRADVVAYFRSLGFPEERAQEAATISLRGYGCIPPKGKRSTALSVELAKSASKDKPISGGKTVQKDGLTYDPASRSFHPTTDAEKGEANAKHPHVPKGSRQGGQFATKGDKQQQTTAAKDQGSKKASRQAAGPTIQHGATAERLKHLSDKDLKTLDAAVAASGPAGGGLQKRINAEWKRRAKAAAPRGGKPGLSVEERLAIDLVSGDTSPFSTSHTSNWVAKAGGLPPRVRAIARAIKRKHPEWDLSRCIATAINAVKYSAATGDSKLPGRQNEKASTVAAHGAAAGQWTALKARSHAHTAEPGPAVELGTVRVSASGDGPRVTGNTLARQRLVAKMKRRRARMTRSTDLSFWNPKLHPRVPKGKHGGGEFIQVPGSHDSLSRPGAGPHETAAALRKHLDATSPKKGETVGVSHSKTRGARVYKAMAIAALTATLAGSAHTNKVHEIAEGPHHVTHQVERVEPVIAPGEGEGGARGYVLPPDYAAARGLGRSKLLEPMAEEFEGPKLPSYSASLVVTPPRPTTKAQRKAGVKVS